MRDGDNLPIVIDALTGVVPLLAYRTSSKPFGKQSKLPAFGGILAMRTIG